MATHEPPKELRAYRLLKRDAKVRKLNKVAIDLRTCYWCGATYSEVKYANECEKLAEANDTPSAASRRARRRAIERVRRERER